MNNEPFRPSFLKNRKAAKPKELFTFESVAETIDAINANTRTANEYNFIMHYNSKNCLCCFNKYKWKGLNINTYNIIEQIKMSQSSPRNAMLVACEIVQMIPKDKTDFYKNIYNLIHNDYVYKDCTALQTSYNWQKLQDIMHNYIPVADEEWKEKIVNIFIGNTEA
jgi:hypothetical protein